MSTVTMLNMAGQEAGTIELKDEIFGIEPNQNAVHAVVKNISKLYSAIDEKAAMSERVKDILKDMSPLIDFSAEVLFDIADEVQINENGMVSIKLINGQILGG